MLMPTRSGFFFNFGDGATPRRLRSVAHLSGEHLEGDPVRRRQGEKARQDYGFEGCAVDPAGASQCRTRTVTVNSPPCGTTTATIDAPSPETASRHPSVEAQHSGLGDRPSPPTSTSRPTSLASRHRHSQHRSEGRSQLGKRHLFDDAQRPRHHRELHRPGRRLGVRGRDGQRLASHRDLVGARIASCASSLSAETAPSTDGGLVERPVRRWRPAPGAVNGASPSFPARGRAYGVHHSSRRQPGGSGADGERGQARLVEVRLHELTGRGPGSLR